MTMAECAELARRVGERIWSGQIGDADELAAVCLYVVANPVRAGLCARAADWPWSGWRYGRLRDAQDDEPQERQGERHEQADAGLCLAGLAIVPGDGQAVCAGAVRRDEFRT